MHMLYANKVDNEAMINAMATKDNSDTESIWEWENELDENETVLTMTPLRDCEMSPPFEGLSLSLYPICTCVVVYSPCLHEVKGYA